MKNVKLIKEPITEKEYKVLMNYVQSNPRYRNNTKHNLLKTFILLYYSGMRLNELSQLRNKDIIDLIENRELIIITHKTKTERKIYFSDAAIKEIKKLFFSSSLNIELEPKSYKVLRVKAKPFSSPSSIGLIQSTNNAIQAVLGERYASHSFRSGLITELGVSGVNPKIIQTYIGHKNIQTTLNYIKPSEEDIRNSLKR